MIKKTGKAGIGGIDSRLHIGEGDAEIIQKLMIFEGVDGEVVNDILDNAFIADYPPKTTLHFPEDELTHYDIVLDGYITIFRLTPDGEVAIVCLISKGHSPFPNLYSMARSNHKDFAETITKTRLLRIDKSYLFKKISQKDQLAFAVLKCFSKQVLNVSDEILRMKSMDLSRRLASFLLQLCSANSGSETVYLPYEKTFLANQLGVTRESLSRGFQKLRDFHVETRNNQIHIQDIEALKNHCSKLPQKSLEDN